MAVDKKISDLTETTAISANDRFVVVDSTGGETKQITLESLPLNFGNTIVRGSLNVYANAVSLSTNTASQAMIRAGNQTANVIFDLPVGGNSVIVATDHTQTLTNKTITTSTINNDVTGNVVGDVTGTATAANTLTGMTSTISELNILDGVTATASELNVLDGIAVTVSDLNQTAGLSAQLALLSGLTPGTVAASKAVTVNSTLGTTFASGQVNMHDVVVAGNLTVQGTQTTLNTNIVEIDDNIIKLNAEETGTPSENGGIEIERGTSDNVQLRWNETSDIWEYTVDGTNFYEIVNVNKAQTMLNKTLTNPQFNDSTAMTANSTELNILDGATVTTTELNILDGVNANSTHLNLINGLTANSTELNLLDGTSASHLDINAVANFEETVVANTTEVTIKDGAICLDVASHDGSYGLKLGGTLVTSSAAELNKLDGVSASQADINAVTNFEETISATTSAVTITDGNINFDIASHDAAAYGLKLGGTLVTSSAAELNILDGVTANSTEINSALDGITANSTELSILNGVTANSTHLNLIAGLTANSTELNILDGVTASTSEINTLDGITSSTSELNVLDGVTVTTAQINYLTGTAAAVVDISSSQTLTTKAIDADNNTITNIDTTAIKPTVLVTESEGIGSNDNDTTFPTSAAVKDYVDATAKEEFFSGISANGVSTADKVVTANSTNSIGSINNLSANTISFAGRQIYTTIDTATVFKNLEKDVVTSVIDAVNVSTNAVSTFNYSASFSDTRPQGTYNNVAFTTSGSGTGFDISFVVNSGGEIESNVVNNRGTNFDTNDTITIADSELGSGGAGALVLTVGSTSNNEIYFVDPASTTDGEIKTIIFRDKAGDNKSVFIDLPRPGWNASASNGTITFSEEGQSCQIQYIGNTTTGRWYSIATSPGSGATIPGFS